MWDARGNVSGPIGDKAAIGFAAGKQQRDGFTQNSITGNDLDSRDGTFAKAQALFLPNANWEARVIYAYERDRDGDYALGDLSAIRIAPFQRRPRLRRLHQPRHQQHHRQHPRHRPELRHREHDRLHQVEDRG